MDGGKGTGGNGISMRSVGAKPADLVTWSYLFGAPELRFGSKFTSPFSLLSPVQTPRYG
jgi:hypothetical protein